MESSLLSQGIAWLLEIIEKKKCETNKNKCKKIKKKKKHLIKKKQNNEDIKPNMKIEEKLFNLNSKAKTSKNKEKYKEKADPANSQLYYNIDGINFKIII